MSMHYTSLKALQRAPRLAPEESAAYPSLLRDADRISSRIVRPDMERLAQVLGATTKTNQHGEFLSVRCWCAQPASFSPDPRALKLLLPEAPEQIANPDEWLFLDTETTGLSGGSGTYPFLVGIAWWEAGGLESNSCSCGSTARSALCCLPCENESRKGWSWLRSTGRASTGRFWKRAIA